MAERFRTGSVDAFDLLGAIVRDRVDALRFPPEGQSPQGHDRVEGVEVDEAAIERHLVEVVTPVASAPHALALDGSLHFPFDRKPYRCREREAWFASGAASIRAR